MAKKVIPAQVAAKMHAAKKDTELLQNVLSGAPVQEPEETETETDTEETETEETFTVEETQTAKETTVETSGTTETETASAETQTETTTETATTTETEEPGLSIFNDVKQATQEDKNLKKVAAAVENIATGASSTLEDIDPNDAVQAKKVADKAHANTVVELCDVGFMLVCVLLTWDFSHENQKRFTLNPDRKKSIAVNLFQIYQLDTKKRDPKKEIRFLILGSYTPMLIIAVITCISNIRRWQQEKKAKKEALLNTVTQEAVIVQENPEVAALRAELAELRSQGKQPLLNQLDKQRRAPVKRAANATGEKKRGVKPGQKRGPYKKK